MLDLFLCISYCHICGYAFSNDIGDESQEHSVVNITRNTKDMHGYSIHYQSTPLAAPGCTWPHHKHCYNTATFPIKHENVVAEPLWIACLLPVI